MTIPLCLLSNLAGFDQIFGSNTNFAIFGRKNGREGVASVLKVST
jgi:hypothetical protein